MKPYCTTQLQLSVYLKRSLKVDFSGGSSSDGGLLLLRQLDEREAITQRVPPVYAIAR